MSRVASKAVAAAGEVVCEDLALGNSQAWRDFAGTIGKALAAAINTLPPALAEQVRIHMELNP